MALDILARYTQFSDPNDQGVAQIAVGIKLSGILATKSWKRRNLMRYEEASGIVKQYLPDTQEYLNLYDLHRLTIGTAIMSNEEYAGVVQELRRVEEFRTEPQFNERLDGIISRVTLLGEPSRIIG